MEGLRHRLRRCAPALLCWAALAVVGTALGPLSDRASRLTLPESFSFRGEDTLKAAGQGVLTASLGGLRTLVADVFWLRAYSMWERRERASCTTYALTACALAPETSYFRDGYANWLAFDFPHWTIRDGGGYRKVSGDLQRAINRRDALAGLAFLDASIQRDPDTTRYFIVGSQIANVKLKDPDLASGYDRRAAETSSAPIVSASLYAGYLIAHGRRDEARAWFFRYVDRFAASGSGPQAALMIDNYRRMIPKAAPEYELLGEGVRRLDPGVATGPGSR